MKFFSKAFKVAQDVFVLLVAIFFFCMFLSLVVEPLAPAITILAVLLFTINTFDRWTTVVLSIGGIVLYVASWYVLTTWGVWFSTTVWVLGVSLWFAAVFWSCLKSKHYSSTKEVAE